MADHDQLGGDRGVADEHVGRAVLDQARDPRVERSRM
jgi:hypothetical protein